MKPTCRCSLCLVVLSVWGITTKLPFIMFFAICAMTAMLCRDWSKQQAIVKK